MRRLVVLAACALLTACEKREEPQAAAPATDYAKLYREGRAQPAKDSLPDLPATDAVEVRLAAAEAEIEELESRLQILEMSAAARGEP
jgi:hypothetical protein